MMITLRYALLLLVLVSGCRRGDWRDWRAPRLPASAESDSAFDAINEERRREGLADLAYDEELMGEAQRHAEWMLRRGRLVHARISRGAENIAWGQTSGREVVADWMSSYGHRRNILGPYEVMGIGKAGPYWCLRLANRTEVMIR